MKKLLLTAALCCAACFMPGHAEDVSVTLTLENGSYEGNGTWHLVYNTNEDVTPDVKITANAKNMSVADGIFDFRSGQSESATFTITSTNRNYYISGFSLNAKTADTTGARRLQIDGQEEVALTSENQLFTATGLDASTPAVFYIKGKNEKVLLTDFTVTFTEIPDGEIIAQLNSEIEVIELWRPILGEELYAEQKALIDAQMSEDNTSSVVDKLTAVAAINNNWMTEANGRLIYIKNVRRPAQYGKYLTGYANNTINTVATPIAQSNWVIERVGETSTFKLFNPETNKYITYQADSNTACNLRNSDDDPNFVAIFELRKNTSANPGTALYITNKGNDDGLNVDRGANNLVAYAYDDSGSSWTIELAGVPASEIQNGKYYRIRSARSLHIVDNAYASQVEWRKQGSLLGVNTAVENNQAKGDVHSDGTKFSGLGTVWKVEDAGDGKHYLRNVATDNQDGMNYFGTGGAYTNVPTSSALGQFEFLSKASSWNRKHPNAVIIKNQEGNYIDRSNNNIDNLGTWTMCDNNWPNNGGIYFFEEVNEAELNALSESYVANENAKYWNADNVRSQIQANALAPSLWSQENVTAALKALESADLVPIATTVAEANDLHWMDSDERSEKNDAGFAIVAELTGKADGKVIVVENVGRHNGSGDFLGFGENVVAGNDTYENIISISHDNTDLSAHWTLQHVPGTMKFFLKNYLNNRYAGFNATQNLAFPTSETEEEAERYELIPHILHEEVVLGFKATSGWYIHQTGNYSQDYVVRWYGDADASAWRLCNLDAEILDIAPEKDQLILSSVNGSISKHDNYAEHHAISLSMVQKSRALTEPMTVSPADAEITDDGKVLINYGTDLEPGEYTLNVPASVFKVNGNKVSAPKTYQFTVNNDGSTTGMTEINAVAGEQVIYDLQGRRVNRTAKGIYIVNGKKVLL